MKSDWDISPITFTHSEFPETG